MRADTALRVSLIVTASLLVMAGSPAASTQPRVIATIEVGDQPNYVGVSPATHRAYIANRLAETVSVVDTVSFEVLEHLHVGRVPLCAVVNPLTAQTYVPTWCEHRVAVISGDLLQTTIPTGRYPLFAVVNPLTNRIYVGNYLDYTVSVIDGYANEVVRTLDLAQLPRTAVLNRGTGRLYVLAGHDISVIDTAVDEMVATVRVGRFPWHAGIDADRDRLYVASHGDGTMLALDGATLETLATIPAGVMPCHVTVVPGGLVFVADELTDRVIAVDPDSLTVAEVIDVAAGPVHTALNPTTGHVFVASHDGNRVTVLDGSTAEVLVVLPVGDGPIHLGVDIASSRVYVANSRSDTVTIIQDTVIMRPARH